MKQLNKSYLAGLCSDDNNFVKIEFISGEIVFVIVFLVVILIE